MTTDTKLAELPAKWRHNAQGCGRRDQHAADTWRSCARELQSALSQQSPSYDALNIIALSVAAALERAGVTECDDPGEAIDVLMQGYERTIARLSDALNAESGPTFMGEMVLPQQQLSAAGVPEGYVLVQQRDAHALAEWGKATAKPDGRSGVVWISARRVSDLLASAPEQRAAPAEQQAGGEG